LLPLHRAEVLPKKAYGELLPELVKLYHTLPELPAVPAAAELPQPDVLVQLADWASATVNGKAQLVAYEWPVDQLAPKESICLYNNYNSLITHQLLQPLLAHLFIPQLNSLGETASMPQQALFTENTTSAHVNTVLAAIPNKVFLLPEASFTAANTAAIEHIAANGALATCAGYDFLHETTFMPFRKALKELFDSVHVTERWLEASASTAVREPLGAFMLWQ
jgi:hypothetical protein